MTLGIIGCLAEFVVMGFFTYRGWHIAVSSLAGSLIVVLFNGLSVTSAYLESYLPGMGGFLSTYFGQFLFGVLLAEMYSATGAGLTVALGISGFFIRDSLSPGQKRKMVIFVLIMISAALEFAGVGASLIVMVIYPVALSLFQLANIPKKYIVAGILGGCLGFGNDLPGSPQPGNTIPMNILGTSSAAGLVPGLIGAVAEIFAMVFLLDAVIGRGVMKGEEFHPETDLDRELEEERDRPAMWKALLPVAVLFVLFNIAGLDINLSLAVTCIFCAAIFYPYFPGRDIKSAAARGITQGTVATVSICAVIGFSTVVQGTEAFQSIVDSLVGLKINPYLLLILCVAFMCMLCGGSATGQAIALPIVGPIVKAAGVSAGAIHRIASFAGAILDTMPYAGTVVMAHAYAVVKNSTEVLRGDRPEGNVVVIGGGLVGCETALHCDETAKSVTIIEMMDKILATVDDSANNMMSLRDAFARSNITVHTQSGFRRRSCWEAME